MESSPALPPQSSLPGPAIIARGLKPLLSPPVELTLQIRFHTAAKVAFLNANAVLSYLKPFLHFLFLQDTSLTLQHGI